MEEFGVEVKNHMSVIEDEDATLIKELLGDTSNGDSEGKKSLVDEYEDIDYGVDASDQNFGEQLFDKLEAAGFAPDDPDLPTVDASQDATTMDTMQNFEYPEYDDSQDYDPFENFRDYGSMD